MTKNDEIADASETSLTDESDDPHREPQTVQENKATEFFALLVGQASAGLIATYSFAEDIVLGRRQLSMIPYAVYLLRIGGLLLAIFGLFAPVVATGLVGVMGWLVDVVVNLLIGFGMFVAAEITLTVREIADRVCIDSVAEENSSQGREPLAK